MARARRPKAGAVVGAAARRRGAVGDRGLQAAAVVLKVCTLVMPLREAIAGERVGSFDAVRSALDQQLHVRGKGVPMMWAVSLVARGFSHNGVRGLRVVTYEGLPAEAVADRVALERTVRERLGREWSPMVRDRSDHETSLVYVQPAGRDGRLMRMIVVDLDGQEVDLVRLELSPDALARWESEGH